MADSKLADLTATTSPADTDILYIVTDPGGTPADKKVAVSNLRRSWDNLITDDLSTTTDLTTVTGSWAISGGVLQHTGGTTFEHVRHNTSVYRPGLYVQAEVNIPTQANADPHGGVVAAWNGTDAIGGNAIMATLWRESTSGNISKLRLHRSNAAFPQDIAVSLALDTYHTLALWLFGAWAVAIVNGTPTAAALFLPGDKATNRVGLTSQKTANFRNFKVWGTPTPTLA